LKRREERERERESCATRVLEGNEKMHVPSSRPPPLLMVFQSGLAFLEQENIRILGDANCKLTYLFPILPAGFCTKNT